MAIKIAMEKERRELLKEMAIKVLEDAQKRQKRQVIFHKILLPACTSGFLLHEPSQRSVWLHVLYTPYSKMAAILVFFCLIANWPFWPYFKVKYSFEFYA